MENAHVSTSSNKVRCVGPKVVIDNVGGWQLCSTDGSSTGEHGVMHMLLLGRLPAGVVLRQAR